MDIRNTAFEIYMKSLDSARVGGSADELKGLSPQETAFVKRLVMTALRRQEFIKSVIRGYAAKKIPARPDAPHAAIILGAVEVLYFHTPDYATVNSYVELAKKKGGKYAGGFVNAILRKICRDRGQIAARPPLPFFPPAFKEMLRRDYSGRQIAAIEKAAVEEPALDITVRADPEDWREKLGGRLMGSGSIRLNDAGSVAELPGFKDGCWWVQDFSAALPVIALGSVEGRKVLDLCAAPGGKSFAAAMQMENTGSILSCDLHPHKIALIEKNAARLGISILKAETRSAAEFDPALENGFDLVIADVPCSGLGVIRKKPDIRYKPLDAIERLPAIQTAILENVCRYVRPGGTLLYSTCTVRKEENEDVALTFLLAHPEFSPEPFAVPAGLDLKNEGYATLLPQKHAADGFFICKLRRHA